ncbi:MAG: tyrosine-protein phosphatase [Candidatus Methanomethylophilaceae archaeon]|nr:tyrosine-protein phosphatase [Candidatus Methanomethylophilaceae archaeon]
MKFGIRTIAVIVIAAAVCSTGTYVFLCNSSEKTLTATVTESGYFGSLTLDIGIDDLHSIGADYGHDLNLTYKGIQKTCFFAKDWDGIPACMIFINHTTVTDTIDISLYNGDITKELGLKVGDTFTLSVKGINKYYPLIPNYLTGGSANREDYSTDVQYGNYRPLTGGGLDSGLIFRSSSPFSDDDDRYKYVDNYYKDNNIQYIIALDKTEEQIAEFVERHPDTDSSKLFKEGKVHAFLASPAVTSHPEEIRKVLDLIMSAPAGDSIGIFCECGKDRTGQYAAIIQALAGASYDEIRADFLLSLCNYYSIKEGSQEYEVIGEMYFDRVMYIFEHPENIDRLTDIDWESAVINHYDAEQVLTQFMIDHVGLDQGYIDALKLKLRG